jgi:hypothetical protein
MSKNELALSMDNVRKEGINIEVNQKDIIEMLVQEKIEQIESEVENLKEEAQLLENEYLEFYDAEFKKHINIPKHKTKGLTCVFGSVITNRSYEAKLASKELCLVQAMDYKHGFNLERRTKYIDASKIFRGYYLNYTYKVEGIEFSRQVEVPVADVIVDLCPKIVAKINKHNERVTKFLAEHPTFISESSITKKLKASFTKEILKTTSASFQKKLSANFGVKL